MERSGGRLRGVPQTPLSPLTPHPPLHEYYAREQDRQAWVRGLFARTARDYDRIEGLMALGTGSWYRRRALRGSGLRSGMTVFDIGVGTGLVAREAAGITGDPARVTGVDPSAGMVDHAKVPAGVRLVAGSAESIPSGDSTVDFLSMGYALRHIGDLSEAFREFHRVLKPGGRLCILEITRPERAWSQAILKAYMRVLVPFAARLVARHPDTPKLMRYYWDTIEACAPPPVIRAALEAVGFVDVDRHVELGVFSEYRALKPPSSSGR